jgi:hypothetical protein
MNSMPRQMLGEEHSLTSFVRLQSI